MKTEVYCTLKIEGIHNWANCDIDEVSYLKHPHRHLFGIKAFVGVTHSDRDVEFIQLGHKIKQYLLSKYNTGHGVCFFGSQSCEMIATELINEFGLVRCEVNEDEENGAIVYND
jgi:hypothetical protein